MQSSQQPPRRVDDQWLQEWVAFGMLELAVYLTKHADFADYLTNREHRVRRASRRKKR